MHACTVAQLCPTLCDLPVAYQAPLFMGFSKQEYWSGLPFPPLGDLFNPEIEPVSSASPALAGDSLSLSHVGMSVLKDEHTRTHFHSLQCTMASFEY